MEQIKKFIRMNGLTFQEGKRNSDSVVLSGYALSLGVDDVDTLITAVDEVLPEADSEYTKELERVFRFAESNNYGKWWSDAKQVKKHYKV